MDGASGQAPHPRGAQLMSYLPVGTHGRGLVLKIAQPPAVTAGLPGQAGLVTGGG